MTRSIERIGFAVLLVAVGISTFFVGRRTGINSANAILTEAAAKSEVAQAATAVNALDNFFKNMGQNAEKRKAEAVVAAMAREQAQQVYQNEIVRVEVDKVYRGKVEVREPFADEKMSPYETILFRYKITNVSKDQIITNAFITELFDNLGNEYAGESSITYESASKLLEAKTNNENLNPGEAKFAWACFKKPLPDAKWFAGMARVLTARDDASALEFFVKVPPQ